MDSSKEKQNPTEQNQDTANAHMAFNEIDLTRPPSDGTSKSDNELKPQFLRFPTKVYTDNTGRGRASSKTFELPDWDLAECGRILDVESYVRRAFRNKKNLFLKEGYEFVSANPIRSRYIKKRLEQMEAATGVPTKILLGQTVWSLINSSNAFWVKVRNKRASGGKVRVTPSGKILEPVAGYFPMAQLVRFKRDEYGKVLKYEQEVPGKLPKEFSPDDVIHFYFDKREGFSVGTPVLASVKDDIRALRRIEEHVEQLIHQHLFPLFHIKIGTEQNPAKPLPDGTDEVKDAQLTMNLMPSDGCWVTSERYTIAAVGAKGSPVAVEKIIEHYKQRIFTGLGNSSVDMGEGGTANRSTAQTMSQNLIQDTKADQKEFAEFIEAFVIKELLLESTFPQDTLFDEENRVYLKFNEIDFEARQAKENHLTDMFLKNAITHDEMRTSMGREPFEGDGWPSGTHKRQMFTKGDGDWARTNYGLIERDKIILQSLDEPGTAISQSESKSRTKVNEGKSAGGNAVANKNQPENQYGTRTSTKIINDSESEEIANLQSQLVNVKRDLIDMKSLYVAMRDYHIEAGQPQDNIKEQDISVIPSLKAIFRRKLPLDSIYNELLSGLTDKTTESQLCDIIDKSFESARDKLNIVALRAYRIGLQDTGVNPFDIDSSEQDTQITAYTDKCITTIKDIINKQQDKYLSSAGIDLISINVVFDVLRKITEDTDSNIVMRAYNYGRAIGCRSDKSVALKSMCDETAPCDIHNTHTLICPETDAIIYTELCPLQSGCTCIVGAVD